MTYHGIDRAGMAMSSSYIPNIKTHPVEWFNYFDKDHGGTLDATEVVNALAESFPSMDRSCIHEIVEALWPCKHFGTLVPL